ncbi:hypothetical protein ES707_00225 [subsurface metagenome]
MPIKDISEIRRMPRLGKIRLGEKVKPEEEGKNPYPRATDYFVVPDEIKEIVGDTPKKLNIMFPTEKTGEFAQQWLRCYSFTQGLVCKGDGSTAIRKIDVETGDIARHTTAEWVFKEWGCDPETCEQYSEKQCRRVMNLLFLIPDVPGIGVWQLDTTSFYSIVNVNSCVDLIKRLCGRISFIPLTLSLEPQIVEPPGIKKKTVHILQIRSDVKLAAIQKLGRVAPEVIMLPALEEEEAPGDLYPEQKLVEAEPRAGKERAPTEPGEEKSPNDITEDDVPDMNAVVRVCFHFWGMQPVEICGQLGYKTMTDLNASGISPWEVWLTIKQLKQPPEPEAEPQEPEEEPAELEQAEQQVEELWPEDIPSADETQPEPEPIEETGGFINMDWLEEQLKMLRDKKLKAWSESNLLSYIKTTYRVEGKTVLEAVAKLDKGAATHFMKRVQDTLQMV